VVAQGPISSLLAGGVRSVAISCNHPDRAVRVVAPVPGVAAASAVDGGLRVELRPEAPVDREIVTEHLRRLLDHGVAVERVAPAVSSLEDRFLSLTTPLEDRI
jgi:hypothetical protein